MDPLMIGILAFLGVSALIGGGAMLLRAAPAAKVEDRLDMLTGQQSPTSAKPSLLQGPSVLARSLDDNRSLLDRLVSYFGDIHRLFEQADVSMTISKLALICGVLALMGMALGIVIKVNLVLLPLVAAFAASLPVLWLLFRRKRRLKKFATQLPDALEMIARALRAGQSLAAGFNMVANEMSDPIAREFGRVFDEQNLGCSMEESLDSLTDRVPNLDLKFFATAVVLQRQTGGDLAEILDKIGNLIRERFKIWGQVQALTGEGRLSGVVLLALPPLLFMVVYQLNPDYISVLFTDPLGKKMLAGAVIMQLIGAFVIRKIVNIKV